MAPARHVGGRSGAWMRRNFASCQHPASCSCSFQWRSADVVPLIRNEFRRFDKRGIVL
jgi:hypothetical protein